MKLFTSYNRINLFATIIIVVIGSFAFGLLLHYILVNQIDEDLIIERNEITTYVREHQQLPSIIEVHDQYTKFKKINQQFVKERFYTNEQYNSHAQEDVDIRNIDFSVTVGADTYLATVSKSLEQTENLAFSILIISLVLIILIFAASLIINRFVLKKLWQPFYETLASMENFKLNDARTSQLLTTPIDEFSLLNSTLNNALNKAQHDYNSLKEFTENASHELQTPLAIIRSKLDLLIQNENLSREQSETIYAAYEAISNLSKMNKSLLLIAKIENGQFNETEQVDVHILLNEKLNQFKDLWNKQELQIETDIQTCVIHSNKELINILLNNVLSNATRHNKAHGCISIELHQSQLKIANTGKSSALNTSTMFKRFNRQDANVHHGLGLSIVQQICNASGFCCSYQFKQPDLHTFAIGI